MTFQLADDIWHDVNLPFLLFSRKTPTIQCAQYVRTYYLGTYVRNSLATFSQSLLDVILEDVI